jgi:hypothetical protein
MLQCSKLFCKACKAQKPEFPTAPHFKIKYRMFLLLTLQVVKFASLIVQIFFNLYSSG